MATTAITPKRDENFADWYQEVIKAADLAENSPVRGCMIFKPYGYAIWENIQRIFDTKLKERGIENAYFPLLIPVEFLSKEAEHVEGFAKECAVVTHHRLKKDSNGALVPDGQLHFPLIIRPTSEAIIGNSISRWIKSYRDLPLKLNQWCNVFRWELRPRLFLRTSEFLWQEGHTAFETENEARKDALEMLDVYSEFMTDYLALPVIKGEKTPEEKFPGAENTYTLEAMMQDGKALQAGTTHYLGQTFAKAFDIKFSGRDGRDHNVYTASWGISTRLIGGVIMAHGDDDGLILPPKIAPVQVVIIPILRSNEAEARAVKDRCTAIKKQLDSMGIRTQTDFSEMSSSDKIWKWIIKGAPIRFEIGLRELDEKKLTLARRDLGKAGKTKLADEELHSVKNILEDINRALRAKAEKNRDEHIHAVRTQEEAEEFFQKECKGFVRMSLKEAMNENFSRICEKYSLSRRCIPFDDPQPRDNKDPSVLVARAY